MDGSCSGIQNLSLAFCDEIGGAAVNIMPSAKPSDIYQLVAGKAIEQLEKLAAPNEPSAQTGHEEDEGPSDAELTQWWLEFGITRKITKRNCMTFPYGSKQRGF